MDIQEVVKQIKLNKRHGLVKSINRETGISMPTIKKYLDGDIVQPKALIVLNKALEIIKKEKS